MIVYSEKKYIWQSFHNKAGGKKKLKQKASAMKQYNRTGDI